MKKAKMETEKVKQIITNILRGNNIELNKLIYAKPKVVCDKFGVPLRNR